MYKIIGADGKEYGPADVEELRKWMTEGRLNGQTLVKAEGETQWQPAARVVELAAWLPVGAAASPAPFSMGAGPSGRDEALRRVKGPAVGLVVAGVFNIVAYGMTLVSAWLIRQGRIGSFVTGDPTADKQIAELFKVVKATAAGYFGTWGVVRGVIYLTLSVLILVAAVKMRRLESHILCLIGCAAAMVPLFAPCCVGLPFGIWALVVLLSSEVKSSFH